VTHLIPGGDVTKYGKFDYHFWVDWGEDGLPVDHEWMPTDGGKTIYVCSDAHIDEKGKTYRFHRAKKFDYVFFNQKRAFEEYVKTDPPVGQYLKWLPHAVEPQAYPKFNILKKYDVCFIGHFQDTKNYNGFTRVDALDRLFKEFPNFYFGTRNPLNPAVNMFEDAAKKFSQSKIVFNISIADDINMRVFEALSTGSFLLTNHLPTLGELFTPGQDLATYKTLDEMVEKARYYLDPTHEDEREQIAHTGHVKVRQHHAYYHRVLHVLQTVGYPGVETLINTQAPVVE
jgi:hypothetical protein